MTEFGDIEPEDSWDPDDPIPDLIRNLVRRLALLMAVRELTDRDRLRLADLRFDLEHVLDRIQD